MYAPIFTKAIGRMEISETRWYRRMTFFFITIKTSVSNLLRAVVGLPNVRHISVWKILLYVRSEVFMLLRLFFTFPSDLFLLNKIFMPLALYFYYTYQPHWSSPFPSFYSILLKNKIHSFPTISVSMVDNPFH